MVGQHTGYVTSQGLILARRLAAVGHRVGTTSSCRNRYMRLLDIHRDILRTRKWVGVQCLEVYGGPSFLVEDGASLVGKRLGQRIIMVLHGGALPDFSARFPRWTKRVFRRADAIVTPSGYLARTVKTAGFSARVIPNVVDVEAYLYRHRASVRPRLLWMRSFHPIWNPALAVRVLALLQRAYPEATLVMAGQDKGEESSVEALSRELGVRRSVRFVGFLDHAGKLREGANADIFLTTNRVDNMPVAVLEAAAMGLPIVATSVGGIPDLLEDGESALLVPDDDAEAMTEAIRRLLLAPAVAARLSENGRKLADTCSWESVRPQWERLFEEVLDRRSDGRGIA